MAINAYIIKEARYQIDGLTLHLQELENEEQTEPKISRRKNIITVTGEINDTEKRKTTIKIKEIELFFWKVKQNWHTLG